MPVLIRVLLVDDHPAIRAGVTAMLGLHADFEVIAEASTGAEAVRLRQQHAPDLTLMDVRLPGMDGIETLMAIRAADAKAKAVMLSSEALPADVWRSMEAGACGFLPKSLPHALFAKELRHAYEHGWCAPYDPQAKTTAQSTQPNLTSREMEVLGCLRRGLSNADIGKALGISPETAITHVKALMQKLNAANRTEVVTLGYEMGLLRVEGKPS